MYDLIIIGGGVSGLTSAIYAGSRGMKTCVIESEGKGGVIGKVSQITHFPGVVLGETGKNYYTRLLKQVLVYKDFLDLKLDKVVSCDLSSDIKTIITEKSKYEAKSIIIANGTSPNKLLVEGEDEYTGCGVSNCAVDDAPKYKNCEVFIVGGSDGALKEALYISQYASKVHIVHFEDSFTGVAEFKDKILSNPKKFILHFNSRIQKLSGDGIKLTDISIINEKDNSVTNFHIDNTCLFKYIGSSPNTDIYNDIITLDNGYIVTDENMKTSVNGVYAVGDIRKKAIRQVATAANDGVIASINAFNYINNK